MKIAQKKEDPLVQTCELKPGETFMYDRNIYMIVKYSDNIHRSDMEGKTLCVNIATGHPCSFSKNSVVSPFDCIVHPVE